MSSIFTGINEVKRSPEPDYDDPSWDEKVSNVGQKAKQAQALKAKGKEPRTRWNPETKKYYVDFSDDDVQKESVGLPYPGTYEETNDMFKSSGQRRIGSLTTEDEQIDGMAQGEIREIIKNAVHIKNQLDKGVSLDGWMYSFVTVSNDKLNSVAEQINNPNIEEQGVAEGKEDKIKQLKQDHATAVHWSKNDTNPHKREAARQKAEKIKAHLEKQYKQGVAEGSIKDVEAKIRTHDQRKADREQAGDPYVAHEIHSHNIIRKQLLDKRKRAQAAYQKKIDQQDVAEGSDELYQKAIRKYVQQVAHDYLGGGNAHLYGANKFDSEMFGVSQEQAKQDFKTLFPQALKQLQGVAEAVDIGQEWMSDTELDQYVPERLQQQWRELLGYDMNGNPSAYWANLTGGYEPDVNDPQHRALMVKVANKWFAAKKIPNVKFFDVKDADDELEWLVQIGEQGVAEGSEDSAEKYKAHLLKTAPRIMDFLAKTVKGWRPSEQEMLGAIDTAYTVMKHTGDVRQAGKAMMDELNTLHRMSQGQQGVAEEKCPHCGGVMVSEELMNEKKDACYYKVKSRYKVWPSAYASGALVKCRKSHGNWGNGSKNESSILEGIERADENLHQWFKEKWVRFGPDGKIRGACARGDDSEGKPKCLPQSKAQNLGKKGRASAAARKRREDPNPERSGPAINVNTKKK